MILLLALSLLVSKVFLNIWSSILSNDLVFIGKYPGRWERKCHQNRFRPFEDHGRKAPNNMKQYDSQLILYWIDSMDGTRVAFGSHRKRWWCSANLSRKRCVCLWFRLLYPHHHAVTVDILSPCRSSKCLLKVDSEGEEAFLSCWISAGVQIYPQEIKQLKLSGQHYIL